MSLKGFGNAIVWVLGGLILAALVTYFAQLGHMPEQVVSHVVYGGLLCLLITYTSHGFSGIGSLPKVLLTILINLAALAIYLWTDNLLSPSGPLYGLRWLLSPTIYVANYVVMSIVYVVVVLGLRIK